jgi:hypothetical protein
MLHTEGWQIMRKSDDSENVVIVLDGEKGFLTQNAMYREFRLTEVKSVFVPKGACLIGILNNVEQWILLYAIIQHINNTVHYLHKLS